MGLKRFENFNQKEEIENYMFFSNLKNICDMVTKILEMDNKKIDKMLTGGHDWASDHISKSKESISHVYNWLKSEERDEN